MAEHLAFIQSAEIIAFFTPQGQSGQFPAAQFPPQVSEYISRETMKKTKVLMYIVLSVYYCNI